MNYLGFAFCLRFRFPQFPSCESKDSQGRRFLLCVQTSVGSLKMKKVDNSEISSLYDEKQFEIKSILQVNDKTKLNTVVIYCRHFVRIRKQKQWANKLITIYFAFNNIETEMLLFNHYICYC